MQYLRFLHWALFPFVLFQENRFIFHKLWTYSHLSETPQIHFFCLFVTGICDILKNYKYFSEDLLRKCSYNKQLFSGGDFTQIHRNLIVQFNKLAILCKKFPLEMLNEDEGE